jgi:histidine triad (HIT) family protein
MDNCIFCKMAKGEIPCKKAFEDDKVLAFHDISPQAPVHILIIPKKHIADLAQFEDGDKALLGELLGVASNLSRTMGFAESGFRVVINTKESAGQSVFHMHLHLLSGRKFYWPPG